MCIFARATRKPVPKMHDGPQAQHFGEEVHTDVWGPSPVTSKRGCRYFITFTDDTTHYTVIYLLRSKAEALGTYKTFEVWALTQQHCAAIKVLQLDCSGEYLSNSFDQHLKSASMARRLTVHDTPQLNGVAEWLNRTLVERIQAFTHMSGLPKFLWGKTVWVHDANGTKLDARACEGHWLGFNTKSHAHRVYFSATRNVTTEHNMYFSMAAQLKGEEIIILGTERKQHATQPTPTTLPPIQTLMQKSHTPTSPLSPLTPLSDFSHTSASTGVEGDNEADPGRTPRLT